MFSVCISINKIYSIQITLVVLNCSVRYYALLNCNSFIHVHILALLVYNSCVASTFSYEWNKEVPDLP